MKTLTKLLLITLLSLTAVGCSSKQINKKYEDATYIELSDEKIKVDGKPITSSGDVYLSNDIIYYHDIDKYESGNKYGEGNDSDKHTEEEALNHQVINITKAGTYVIEGNLSKGQIRINLGENAKDDESAKVKLVLNGVDLTSTVSPAILIQNVYECGTQEDEHTAIIDTSNAGINVIIADNTINNINGSYVAKIFKDSEEEKKLVKQDGAFYSYMSMNINSEVEGTGILNISAENEGLDSEKHLTINGGNINIISLNDGINTNEDNISVTTINGGTLKIVAGLGEEGDGIDSNGYLVINGGNVIVSANPKSDGGLDSDCGSIINGGNIIALGSTMDWAEDDSKQVTLNLSFREPQDLKSSITIRDTADTTIFEYDLGSDDFFKNYNREFSGLIMSSSNFSEDQIYSLYIDAKQMAYSSNFVGNRNGMKNNFNGDKPLEEFNFEERKKEIRPDNPPIDFVPKDGHKPEEGRFEMEHSEFIDTADLNPNFEITKLVNTFGGIQIYENKTN